MVQPWLFTHHTIGQLSRIVPRDAIQSENEQCDNKATRNEAKWGKRSSLTKTTTQSWVPRDNPDLQTA